MCICPCSHVYLLFQRFQISRFKLQLSYRPFGSCSSSQSGALLEKIDFIWLDYSRRGMLVDEVELVKDHNSKPTRISKNRLNDSAVVSVGGLTLTRCVATCFDISIVQENKCTQEDLREKWLNRFICAE